MGAVPAMRFRVQDWVAFGPGLGTLTGWSGSAGTARPANALEELILPPMLRRRIGSAGQIAFRAAHALGKQQVARFVFCSRYGEMDRTFRILNSIATSEPASPADFTLSVHNALAGLLSIEWGNTAGHTAVCAGADTFGFGLLEAVASLNDAGANAVMLIYFEDSVPPPYDELAEESESRIALAMLLRAARDERGEFALAFEPRSQVTGSTLSTAQSMDFIKFMLSDEHERRFVGDRAQWRWQRCV
jgi:hypothetical protein